MKYYILLFISLFLLSSCEDVIEVDLSNEEPRLIVDALLRVDTSQNLTHATILVSLSSSFFGEIEPVEVERLELVESTNNVTIVYESIPGRPGVYQPSEQAGSPVIGNQIETDFLSDPDAIFNLYVTYNSNNYLATTSFVNAVPIDSVTQGDGQLFGEDQTEVMLSFTDIINEENFYLIDFDFNEYLPTEDRFYDGQQFEFSYFYDSEFMPGETVTIKLLGVDFEFFNYISGILEQSQQGQNGPFQTPTATVRGNFLNITGLNPDEPVDNTNRPDNFILGYFSVSQEYSASITIE